MKNWKVTWIEGNRLREGVVYCDFASLHNVVGNIGCYDTWSIIKVELVPE